MCTEDACDNYYNSCRQMHPCIMVGFPILLGVTGFMFICGMSTYINITTFTMTQCYPVDYSTEVKICYDGVYRELGPYPVSAWVKFLYYNPKTASNQTIIYNLACGSNSNNAMERVKSQYPYMRGITCGIKSWLDNPIVLFPNGSPWNQKELMFGFGAASVSIIVIFITIFIIVHAKRQKRRFVMV